MRLMVYNKYACKEFLLPNLHDADYSLLLCSDIFFLKSDVNILMETSSKGWEMISGEDYYIKIDHIRSDRHLLRDQDIIEIKTSEGERLKIIIADVEPVFPVTEKYSLQNMKEISVGKSEGNLIQYRFMELMSSFHMTLSRHSDGCWYLTDTSSNGVFYGNKRVQGRQKLKPGDHIEVFGLHIIFLQDTLAVGALYGELKIKNDILRPLEIPEYTIPEEISKKEKEINYFHRSPRTLPDIYREEVEIEAPPPPKVVKQKPLYLTIGPAFTMAIPMMLGCGFAILGSRLSGHLSGAFMYTGMITAIASAIIGVIWAVANMNYGKKESIEEENQRFNAYSNYLIRIADDLRDKYNKNIAAMNQMYPSASQCVRYNRNSSELWNRNYSHGDFLFQRLGIGDIPFQMNIGIPKDKFTLINDSLSEKPRMIKEEFQTLHKVPVGISLLEKPLIGLVGGEGCRGAIRMMHTLVAGIAASHSYTDVKLVFIYREKDRARLEDWECMRWFPHVWSEDKNTRYMAADELETGDIFFELSNILRGRDQKKGVIRPHYVLFISDPSILDGEVLAKYIYEANPAYGITTFLMVESLEQLPNACEEVIENDEHFQGMYNLLDTDNLKRKAFVPDRIDRGSLELFGRTLANIRLNEIESSSEIPGRLDFLEMYGVGSPEELNVSERWRKNRNYNSMKALIGRKAGNADCYLDIHEKFHGPHGLVAGTTGSGKSETLQTYILSLAVNFSPEDVCFFIIDFKGGGMANLFSDLPHLSGQISNLSGNQVQRAMISIKSENQRRQKIFSDYGVNNINSYTRLYKNHETPIPIPHLFIIIDEFAELKREEPEFMQELISVAQVGRSLGVHLILATQKPGGTVDDNIWSNTRFRLCLRVQDRQDSNDMLHKPDAAFITQAGRCYLQVGNDEIYELFQSGYSGAPYRNVTEKQNSYAQLLMRTGRAELSGIPRRKHTAASGKEQTQLEAVIEHLKKTEKESGCQKVMQLWRPVLKTQIFLDDPDLRDPEMDEPLNKRGLEAVIGLYDDPRRQLQKPVKVSLFEGGHHAVCGSVVSGKSTLLQTLVYSFISRYTPDELQLYLLDFSSHMLSPFENAPHVGGVIYDNQEEKTAKFMHMLASMLDERKALLKGGNYGQYIQAYGIKIPALLVVIDNFASFREKTKNEYDDLLLRALREGAGYGIYFVTSAAGFSMAEIPSRMADHFRTVISLEQPDKFKYMELLRASRLEVLPESDIKGRGLVGVDGRILEFQTALCLSAEDDFVRGQKIERYCQTLDQQWTGAKARPIPEIPEKPDLMILNSDARYQQALTEDSLLPVGYRMEDASIYSLDLSRGYCFIISGKGRSGKTNTMKVLLYSACQKNGNICIVERGTPEFRHLAEENKTEYVTNSKDLFLYFEKNLLPEFSRRNKKKRELIDAGYDEEEIFEIMKRETPYFIFLSDLAEFLEMVYKPDDGVGAMSGFLENILEKGSLHNIFFIGGLKAEDESTLSIYRAYNLFISYKKGIHLGGNLSSQKVFNFSNISFSQQSKTAKKGIGHVPNEEEDSLGIEIVIPLARKQK